MCSQQAPKIKPTPLHLHIFLSSPGDVADERALARRLLKEELPYDPFLRGRITVDVVSWDDPAARTPMPATLTPQEAVNRFGPKPSQCDIVIVVLWSRLGTHLDVAKFCKSTGEPYLSGTEWEYEDACNAQPQPAIFLYQRTEEPKIGLKDPAHEERFRQYALVEQFLTRFQNPNGSFRGSLTTYDTPTAFKERLANDLKHILHERLDERDLRSVAPAEPLWTGSPYPGLRAFTSKEAAIFFGRGRETDALIARLRDPDQRFLAVIGASGTGKSSLIHAGLLPRLAAGAIEGNQNWGVLIFTPAEISDDPFQALAAKLSEVLPPVNRKPAREIAAALATKPQRITEYAAVILAGRPAAAVLVLVIDQLEELFTLTAEKYRAAFFDLLAHTAAGPRLRVLTTLRVDFLPQGMAERKLAALLQGGTVPLGPPGPTALADIIHKPAERAGLDLEESLVEEILKDAGDDPGALPLVAFCLEELYRRTAPEHHLTVAAYEDLGRLHGAIGQQAKALLEDLRETEGAALDIALPQLFRALVHVDAAGTETRRRGFREELGTEAPMPQLVETLVNRRLLLADEAGGRPTVILAHEALFEAWPALRDWLEGNRVDLILRDELSHDVERWQSAKGDEGFLLPKGRRLEEAIALAERRADLISPSIDMFIQASCERVRREAEQWDRRWRDSVRLAALSRQETAAGNAVTGILLALEALPPDADAPDRLLVGEAVKALHNALQLYCHRTLRGHKDIIFAAAFSRDGTRVVTASDDGTMRLWDATTGQEVAALPGYEDWAIHTASTLSRARVFTFKETFSVISPDGSRVITVFDNGALHLREVSTGEPHVILRGHEGRVLAAAFSPDGASLVTTSDDGTARLWNVVTGAEEVLLRGHKGPVCAAAFNSEGTQVVTASWDGTARLWPVFRSTFCSTQELIEKARRIIPRQLTQEERERFACGHAQS